MPIPSHVAWLTDTGQRVTVASGHVVEVWEFNPGSDPAALSAWARHFRQQYIDDAALPSMVAGTPHTPAEYCRDILFPDASAPPGPSTRAGDFAEILVADFIEFQLGYWCPRDRYKGRFNRNDSTKGADIIGFKFVEVGKVSPADEMYVVEAKAGMTATAANRLGDAVQDSTKDALREGMTLNALKQRMFDKGEVENMDRVERFQNESDRPFRRFNGAAAVLDDSVYQMTPLQAVDASAHGNANQLRLLVIRGADMMKLVHALYLQAANEA